MILSHCTTNVIMGLFELILLQNGTFFVLTPDVQTVRQAHRKSHDFTCPTHTGCPVWSPEWQTASSQRTPPQAHPLHLPTVLHMNSAKTTFTSIPSWWYSTVLSPHENPPSLPAFFHHHLDKPLWHLLHLFNDPFTYLQILSLGSQSFHLCSHIFSSAGKLLRLQNLVCFNSINCAEISVAGCASSTASVTNFCSECSFKTDVTSDKLNKIPALASTAFFALQNFQRQQKKKRNQIYMPDVPLNRKHRLKRIIST